MDRPKNLWFSRWEELQALASEPVENHVFFAEHFSDAVNGLYTTLSTFAVCSAIPQGQWVNPTLRLKRFWHTL